MSRKLAVHESEPSKNVTDAMTAVGSSEDSVDTVHDAVGVPALIPCAFNFSFTGNDLSQRASESFELLVFGLSSGDCKDDGKAGEGEDELGHGEVLEGLDDQPVGVGFSYADNDDAYCSDEDCVGEDMFEFLNAFVTVLPQFSTQDFFVTGESYAGHYVPAVSWAVYQKIQSGDSSINLRGFAIGNGLVNPAVQYAAYRLYALDNNLISQSQYNGLERTETECVTRLQKGDTDSFTQYMCESIVETILQDAGNINVYDIRKQCTYQPLCYNFTAANYLLTTQSVIDSLGVSEKAAPWESCNNRVHEDFMIDWWSNLEVNVPTMVDEGGLRVLVYSGDQDYIVNWYGGRDWVSNMTWSGQNTYNSMNWQNWITYTNGSAGEFKTATSNSTDGSVTFLRVYAAGHMVPMDQPENSYQMLKNFLHNTPFMTKKSAHQTQ